MPARNVSLATSIYGGDIERFRRMFLIPDVSSWFPSWTPGFAPPPRAPEPMVKGKPQEPASAGSSHGEAIGKGFAEGFSKALKGTVRKEGLVDTGVYLLALVIALIALWSVLK